MGIRLLVRTDLRNDKDKRALRLCQEVKKKYFFLRNFSGFYIVGNYNN
jgi:hypothetical protein